MTPKPNELIQLVRSRLPTAAGRYTYRIECWNCVGCTHNIDIVYNRHACFWFMHCELVFVTFSGFNIFSDADCSDRHAQKHRKCLLYNRFNTRHNANIFSHCTENFVKFWMSLRPRLTTVICGSITCWFVRLVACRLSQLLALVSSDVTPCRCLYP